jgi:hypothetical protein
VQGYRATQEESWEGVARRLRSSERPLGGLERGHRARFRQGAMHHARECLRDV